MIRFCIITVTYNAEDCLERTIQSVIGQTYPHVDYVIVDGGSKDGTLRIIEKYSSSLTRWISEPDKGIYDGMNKGIVGNLLQSRYSYTLSRNVVGDYGANNLMYIPASRKALDAWNFIDIPANAKNGVEAYSAKEQRDDFWAFIQQDSYLSKHTGEYAQRGGAVMPWHHQLDFKFLQDFYLNVGGKRNTLQLGVDIENVLNLINKHWGLYQQVNTIQPLTINKDGSFNFAKTGNQKLSETYSDYNDMNSTYQIMFSLRYIFN